MKTKTLFLRALLGATALTAFTVGQAHAAGTAAGTNVQNIFTLDYQVGGVDQDQITNDGTGGNADPTSFTVDRVIDLSVTEDATTVDSTPGATEALSFTLTNDGNDSQQYSFALLDEAANNDFDGSPYSIYYEDPSSPGTFILFDGTAWPTLTPDQSINVEIRGDIPTGATDGQQETLSLLATTVDGTGTPVTQDTDGNDADLSVVENVFGDDPASADASSGDSTTVPDGIDSATSTFIIATADLAGDKVVNMITEDGSNCTNFATPADSTVHPVPGACIEYVITVTNTGSEAATAIAISDTLNTNLTFVDAVDSGFTVSGTLTEPAANTDCGASTCTVAYSGGTLAAPVAPATSTSATITIRALVK